MSFVPGVWYLGFGAWYYGAMVPIKGGPEPLEKDSHEFLASKRDDRFPTLFLKWYQKHVNFRFSYLLWQDNFCKGPRTLRKFPQKCQKIAGC